MHSNLFIYKTFPSLYQRPGEITLVCIGPLTNIALALKTYADFAAQVQSIYLMGGNHLGIGNTCRIGAEFNFYMDSEAAHIVLADAKCPITILPWEAFTKRAFFMTLVSQIPLKAIYYFIII